MGDKSDEFLTDGDRERLESAGHISVYKPGAEIISQDTRGEAVHWIRRGNVQVDYTTKDDERLLADLGAGEMFGEISFIDHKATSAAVRAIDEVETVAVDHAALFRIIEEDEAFAARFYHSVAYALATRLRRQDTR